MINIATDKDKIIQLKDQITKFAKILGEKYIATFNIEYTVKSSGVSSSEISIDDNIIFDYCITNKEFEVFDKSAKSIAALLNTNENMIGIMNIDIIPEEDLIVFYVTERSQVQHDDPDVELVTTNTIRIYIRDAQVSNYFSDLYS